MGVVIGIPPGLDEARRLRAGRATHYVDVAYARALCEAGAAPIYLPPELPAETAIRRIDGLLLPGGDDFVPDGPYPAADRLTPAPAEQIAADDRLLGAALAAGLPVLAVCYGMQLLARHAGGRLLHHLPLDRPESANHRLAGPDGRHPVEIEPDSRLATLLGGTRASVNSRHHQGVAEPGRGLQVCARAEDGLIEAIEAPGESFVIGVQWHPEDLEPTHRGGLFGGFVAACGGAAAR